MNKSKAMTALKSLLVSGCALLAWSMPPVFLTSTLTSCEKLEDLFGNDHETNEDGSLSSNHHGVATYDGASPYFQLETTRMVLPAVKSEEGIQVKCQTNIMHMHYVLEKFKKFNEHELTEREDYSFILENPEHPFHSEEFLSYYTNYSCEKQTDNLLIYATDKDSLLATIPIEQAAAPHVTVTKTETEVNAVTLTLKGQNEARYYSAYLSTDSIPLYQVIEDLKNGGPGLPFNHTLDLSTEPTCTFSGLKEATKYFIYLQGGTETGLMYGVSLYTVTTSMRGKEDALILEYVLNNRTVYLPFEGRVKGVIDWGDGVTESIDKENLTSADLSHSYAPGAASTVSVAFKGTVETLTTNYSPKGEVLKASLTGITQWGSPELKRLSLQDAIALKHLAADTKGALSALTDFTSCFARCTSLKSIPADLFASMKKVTRLPGIFYECKALTEIPEGLFDHNPEVTYISYSFDGCSNLRRVPAHLFDQMRILQSTTRLFHGCHSLSGESPYTLVSGKKVHLYERQYHPTEFLEITNHSETYDNCTGLTDYGAIPNDWK